MSVGSSRSRPAPRRSAAWLALILIVGAALRVAYLIELRAAPDFTEPLADAAFHDYWARGIVSGDWTPPGNEPDPRIPEVPFLRPPGYPYFLAAVYRVFGTDPMVPRVAQMLLGLVNALLAWFIGRRVLGPGAGLILAAFAAVGWTSIYFEGELQAPTLQLTGTWISLLLLMRARDRGSFRWALLAGVALGVTGLVRANVLAFVPVAAIWLGWVLRHRGRSTAIRSAVFVGLGALIAVAPVTWRNYRVSDEFVPVSVNGAVSLYIGNHEGSDGTSAQIPDLEKMTGRPGWNWFRYGDIVRGYSRTEGQEMTYGDVSRAFVSRAREWIAENPGDFARLSLRRAVLFWGPSEISNNKAIRFEKENSVVLRNYPSFSVVLALSLLGLGVALVGRRGGRESAIPDGPGAFLVGSFVVVVFLTYVPFLAAARFRAPLVPLLFLFGAWALRDLIRRVTTRDYSGSAIAVAVAVALFFGVSRGGAESEVDRAWWHTDRGVALKRQDRQDEAIDEFRAALAAIPGYIDAHHGLGDLLLEREDREGALEHYLSVLRHRPDRTDLMMKASVILVDLGRFEDAERFLTNVVKIVPDSPDAHFEYGRALVELGRFEEAIVMLDRSLLLAPNQAPAAVNRGIARARLGRTQAAIDDFAQATEINPLYAEAFFHLAETLQTAGQTADAILAYEQAARVGIVYVEPRVHLGNLHNEAGRWEEAIAGYEDALRIDPNHVVAMYNIAGSLGNAGRLEDAARHLTKALEIEPANELCRQRLLQVNQLLRTRGSRAE